MAKINLLKKEWTGKSQVKKLRMVSNVIMFLAVGGFLLQTFYIGGRLVYLRSKTKKVTSEISTLNNVFASSKNIVENHVWVQWVLEKIGLEKKNEYKYKDYLVEINSWLTGGTSLVGVSFTKKDEISFMVFANGVDDYREFETKFGLKQKEEDFGFKMVEIESLSRVDDGTYKAKFKLKI
jgi:hypothetical protein